MNFKSTVFGLSLMAAATSSLATDVPGSALSAPGGRFVYGQVSSARSDQYLLDTQTGRLWQMQCAKKGAEPYSCEANVLTPVLFSENGTFVVQSTSVPLAPVPVPKH